MNFKCAMIVVGLLASLNSYAIDLNGAWKGTAKGALESTTGWQQECQPFEFDIQQDATKLIFKSSQIVCGSTTNNWENMEFVIEGSKILQDRQQGGLVQVGFIDQNMVSVALNAYPEFSFTFEAKPDGVMTYHGAAKFKDEMLLWNNELVRVNP